MDPATQASARLMTATGDLLIGSMSTPAPLICTDQCIETGRTCQSLPARGLRLLQLRTERADAACGLLQLLHGRGIGQPHVTRRAERAARNQRDSGLFQQQSYEVLVAGDCSARCRASAQGVLAGNERV